MRWVSTLAASMLMIGFVAGLGGCQSKSLGRYNINVAMDAGMRDAGTQRFPTIEVDLVGVNEADAAKWNGYSVSQYFSGPDPLRNDSRKVARTFRFTNEDQAAKELSTNDDLWKEWEKLGATRIFVLANIPGVKASGATDDRRLELPLGRHRWKEDTISVQVERSGVKLRTLMLPETN